MLDLCDVELGDSHRHVCVLCCDDSWHAARFNQVVRHVHADSAAHLWHRTLVLVPDQSDALCQLGRTDDRLLHLDILHWLVGLLILAFLYYNVKQQ